MLSFIYLKIFYNHVQSMFCFNPVDTRCCLNIYSTSVRIDIQTNLGGFHPQLPLKVHQLSPYSCLASSSRPSLKGIQLPLAEGYFSRILHKAHEGITFLTPLPNRLWIYHENCLYPANLYDLSSDKRKMSYLPLVNVIALQTGFVSLGQFRCDLFKKGSWTLWSKSLKKTVKGFILVKQNFFLRNFPAFNHKFQNVICFYSLFGNTFQLKLVLYRNRSIDLHFCIDLFLYDTIFY